MLIVLTRDLNEAKGLITGAVLDWPRQLITEMEEQLGGKDWYQLEAKTRVSLNRRDLAQRKGGKRGQSKEAVAA